MSKLTNLVEEIKTLSVTEVSELVKMLEEEFGVSAAAQMAAASAEATVESADEKSEYTVVLTDVGATKLAVIKAVRELTGLGLGESKAIVDGAPATIKENVPTEEAKAMEAALKEVGATVELK